MIALFPSATFAITQISQNHPRSRVVDLGVFALQRHSEINRPLPQAVLTSAPHEVEPQPFRLSFISHVERVLPEMVGEDEQGYKTVDYSKLPLMMLQAIKELKAENDSLRQQNATIDARLKALEQEIKQAERPR